MVMNLNVLHLGMEDGVLGELDAAEVVAVYHCRFRHLHMQILQEPIKPDGFACRDNRSLVFGLST